jgi:hypothetical protein
MDTRASLLWWTSTTYRDCVADRDRHTTPRRPLSVGDDLWVPFGKRAGEKNRSAVLRDFIRWYLRLPGATLPRRPPAEKPDD